MRFARDDRSGLYLPDRSVARPRGLGSPERRREYGAVQGVMAAQKIAAAAGLLVDEQFEGTGEPTGWSSSGAPDYDYTGTVLEGSQSLFLQKANLDIVKSLSFDVSEFWSRWRMRRPGSWNFGQMIMDVEMTDGNPAAQLYTWFSNTWTFSFATFSSTSFAVDTTYYCWLHYAKGTGSNGVAEFAYSTTSTRPTSSDPNYVATSSGTWTVNAGRLVWNIAGQTGNWIVDDVQVSATDVF